MSCATIIACFEVIGQLLYNQESSAVALRGFMIHFSCGEPALGVEVIAWNSNTIDSEFLCLKARN